MSLRLMTVIRNINLNLNESHSGIEIEWSEGLEPYAMQCDQILFRENPKVFFQLPSFLPPRK